MCAEPVYARLERDFPARRSSVLCAQSNSQLVPVISSVKQREIGNIRACFVKYEYTPKFENSFLNQT